MFRGAPWVDGGTVSVTVHRTGRPGIGTGPQREQVSKGDQTPNWLMRHGTGPAWRLSILETSSLDIRHRRWPGCSDGQRGSFPVTSGHVPTSSYHRCEDVDRQSGVRQRSTEPTGSSSGAGTSPAPSAWREHCGPWFAPPPNCEDTRGTAKTLSPYGLGFGRPPMTVHGPALPVGSRTQRERTTNKTSVEVDVGLENQAMSVDSKS